MLEFYRSADAWRKQPYYSDIKNWARAAAKTQGHVLVSQGHDMIVVTPDGESNLGPVRDDQLIITRRRQARAGTGVEHIIVNQDDPILDVMKLLKDGDASAALSPDELAEAKRQVDAWLARKNA